MRSSEKCKVIEVYCHDKHIATIDAYEGSISVGVEYGAVRLADQTWGRIGLWYGDLSGPAQDYTKAQILSVCREDIEHELFPSLSRITYGRPKVYDIYEFYSL